MDDNNFSIDYVLLRNSISYNVKIYWLAAITVGIILIIKKLMIKKWISSMIILIMITETHLRGMIIFRLL
jgi:hypothetical protein